MTSTDGLEAFSRPTREWFRGAFEGPTRVQREAWAAIAAGRNALVVAPTGSGKTLAAFLWAIDRLSRELAEARDANRAEGAAERLAGVEFDGDRPDDEPDAPPRRTRILYLSPLKALGVDVERNLHAPLVGITQTARRLGLDAPAITVGVRSGDTPASERRALLREPPDILITTPESLFLMLTSQARRTLTHIETVIVDEVHAVAATKRGSHLALTLERLDELLERPAQRIGLSATVRPLDEVARFLAGDRPVDVVAPASAKAFDLRVVVPVDDMSDLSVARARPHSPQPERLDPFDVTPGRSPRDPDAPVDGDVRRAQSIWPHIEASIVERVLQHRSTIVFVNSRQLAERLTARLNEYYEELLTEARDASGDASDDGPQARAPAVERAAGPPTRTPAAQIIGGSGLAAGADPLLARAHHGSVSKEARAEVEEALKAGTLRCVVATSSLELGIDMGDVDLVIQVESPPSVASGLQRVGRAGHQVGAPSRGVLYPKHRADVLHSAVAASRMVAGEIERMSIIANPLDVLAQQTIAAAAMDELDVERWFDLVRRSAPFSSLSRPVFDATLDLVSGRYPSDEFGELRPRVVWDRDAGTLTGRPGAQRLAVTSGGTIPDRGMFGVFLAGGGDADQPGVTDAGASVPQARRGGMRVGELDEEMVYESRVGDVFALGTTSWRIAEITHERVLVTPAFGEAGRLPFWIGDAQGRPAELGEAIGRAARDLDRAASGALARDGASGASPELPDGLGGVVDDRAARNLLAYVRDQRESTGVVPSDLTLVVERVRDELGDWRLVLHSPYGRQVHAPWALIVADRVRERFGVDGAAVANDDGIVVRIPEGDAAPPGAEVFALDPDEIEPIVTREVGGTALFAARFREAAARALLLPRLHPGKRAPLWQQRQRSAQLLEVARRHPTFPIILETVREVLHDVYDLDALTTLAKRIASREVRVVEVETETPSPFANTILFGYVGSFMYEGDSPLAERKAAALALDPSLLADLLGRVELRELLDAAVIARVKAELQRLAPGRRARDAEGVADLLRVLGPLTDAEIAARLDDPDASAEPEGPDAAAPISPAHLARAAAFADDLVAAKRALRVRIAGEQRTAAIEDAARLRDALGVPLPIGVPVAFIDPVPDPVGDLVARFARTHGPFAIADAAERFGLGRAVVREALQRLELARRVVEGEFRPDRQGSEWVDADVLRRIRARSLAALRSEIEPVSADTYARFLPAWQHVGTSRDGHALRGGALRGLDGVVTVIDQLAGVPIPASAWESLVLPARVRDYAPALLDELTTTGEVLWRGHGAIPGGDGWLSLHLADTAAFTLPPAADIAASEGLPDALGERVLESLAAGAQFFRPLSAAVGAPDDQRLADALWSLVWQGRVTNDSLAPLRALVSGGPGGASSAAHRAPRRAARGRLYRGRVAMAPTASGGPGAHGPGGSNGLLASRAGPPSTAGRWSLAPTGDPDATERAHAAGELLLDRYGVVTRGSVMAEELPGGFALAYRVLSRFEESGRARRGYFIERLGAAQFSTAGAVDRLRAFQRDPADGRRPLDTVTLAATDPANPYGAALPWPAVGSDDVKHRPGRKAGGLVAIVDGDLALYVERGGKTLLAFTTDESALRAAAASLADTVRAARIPNLVIERVNGTFVLEHDLATLLQEAGFAATPRGLRLRVT